MRLAWKNIRLLKRTSFQCCHGSVLTWKALAYSKIPRKCNEVKDVVSARLKQIVYVIGIVILVHWDQYRYISIYVFEPQPEVFNVLIQGKCCPLYISRNFACAYWQVPRGELRYWNAIIEPAWKIKALCQHPLTFMSLKGGRPCTFAVIRVKETHKSNKTSVTWLHTYLDRNWYLRLPYWLRACCSNGNY